MAHSCECALASRTARVDGRAFLPHEVALSSSSEPSSTLSPTSRLSSHLNLLPKHTSSTIPKFSKPRVTYSDATTGTNLNASIADLAKSKFRKYTKGPVIAFGTRDGQEQPREAPGLYLADFRHILDYLQDLKGAMSYRTVDVTKDDFARFFWHGLAFKDTELEHNHPSPLTSRKRRSSLKTLLPSNVRQQVQFEWTSDDDATDNGDADANVKGSV